MIECGQAVDEDSSSKRASELITASVDRARGRQSRSTRLSLRERGRREE